MIKELLAEPFGKTLDPLNPQSYQRLNLIKIWKHTPQPMRYWIWMLCLRLRRVLGGKRKIDLEGGSKPLFTFHLDLAPMLVYDFFNNGQS